MSAVLLALASALLFGGMTVALRFALRAQPEADLGAVVTSAAAFVVVAAAAAVEPGTNTDTMPFSTPDASRTLSTPAVKSITSPSPSVEKRSWPAWSSTGRQREKPPVNGSPVPSPISTCSRSSSSGAIV